jgi:hypothetical protein
VKYLLPIYGDENPARRGRRLPPGDEFAMRPSYTHRNIADVADAAPGIGFADWQESRFATDDFDAEQTGFTHHTFKPGGGKGSSIVTSGPRRSTSSSPVLVA